MDSVGVGLVGSQFVSTIHAESLKRVPRARLAAVASPTPGHAAAFAQAHGIPKAFTDYRKMLEMAEVDLVVIGAPNDLHCRIACDAAAAGKHVVCEKPLCLSLAEADAMIAACRKAKVKLMYAEELCFCPKYVRLKKLVDDGALGQVTLVKQSEKHDGPHAAHFWDVERSGGGVAMDMGCHAVEFFRWMLGKPRVLDVYAEMGTYVHHGKTRGDDNALIIVNFEAPSPAEAGFGAREARGGATALAEESWTKLGGMDDRAEVHGSKGVAYANLLQGNAILAYSAGGYDYAVEKGGETKGWTFPIYEEAWNYGFPQEMAHFVDCVADGLEPLETGEDGRAVLEVLFAAYHSAATGRKVKLPFRTKAAKPFDLWKGGNR